MILLLLYGYLFTNFFFCFAIESAVLGFSNEYHVGTFTVMIKKTNKSKKNDELERNVLRFSYNFLTQSGQKKSNLDLFIVYNWQSFNNTLLLDIMTMPIIKCFVPNVGVIDSCKYSHFKTVNYYKSTITHNFQSRLNITSFII